MLNSQSEEENKTPFQDLPLHEHLLKALAALKFDYCTPIQAAILPLSLNRADIIGKAQTGTGKTAAFLVSIINHLLTNPLPDTQYAGEPRALIIAPTRELALQIKKDADELTTFCDIESMCVVGGTDITKQDRHLRHHAVDILIATPGRLLDLLQRKTIFLDLIDVLVLDEADRMLDMGFIPQIRKIIRDAPQRQFRQTLLFSATFNDDVLELAENWTVDPIRIETEPDSLATKSVTQLIYMVNANQKNGLLYNLITQEKLQRVIIFLNRRDQCRTLYDWLCAKRIRCGILTGEIPQHKRIKTLDEFRNGTTNILIATDVAGRGIHIEGVSHVINYTLPEDPDDYVHRIGRTGRAGATGTAISFACEDDAFLIPAIESHLNESLSCTHPPDELLAGC